VIEEPEFQEQLVRERAQALAPTLRAMADVPAPNNLTLIQGTMQATYDDGFNLTVQFEAHPKDQPPPPKPQAKWSPFFWAAMSMAVWSFVYLAVDELSVGNPLLSSSHFTAVVLIAFASFLLGRNQK
jgi:hypothetical protein